MCRVLDCKYRRGVLCVADCKLQKRCIAEGSSACEHIL